MKNKRMTPKVKKTVERTIRLEKLARAIGVSQDIFCNSIRLRWIGREYLRIENATALIKYSSNCIRIASIKGEILEIVGEGMEMLVFSDTEICIEGRVLRIGYDE